MNVRVPHWFHHDLRVALPTGLTSAWGDGLGDLSVGEVGAFQLQAGVQVVGCLGLAGPDDEPHPGVLKRLEVGG